MSDGNNWNFIGRMVADPETSATQSGRVLCKFTLARNRSFNREESDFISCVAWGKTAELIGDHHGKGSLISVTGEGRQERWERDGKKQSKIVLNVESFSFIGGKKEQVVNDDVEF